MNKGVTWISVLLLISFCLTGCAQVSKIDISTISEHLFAFPGLTWNATPDEVRDVLKLKDAQIKLDEQTDIAQDETEPDTWTMLVTGLEFADRPVHSAKFVFVRYPGNDFGLSNVTLFFSDETDMYEIKGELVRHFGQGKDGFEGYRITEEGTVEKTTDRQAPKEDEMPCYWYCDAKFADAFPDETKEAIMGRFTGLYPNASSQTLAEYLNNMLLASLSVSDYHMQAQLTEYFGQDNPYITHNHIVFSGDLFVMWSQQFGK